MFNTIVRAFKNKEVRIKIFITLAMLAAYRLGCWLPIPGVVAETYKATLTGDGADSLLGLLSAITGGALSNGAFLAIGISPYINASIIIQLLTVAIPKLENWSKEGEDGKRKIALLTRIFTLALAIAQAVGIVLSFNNASAIDVTIFASKISVGWVCALVAIILVAGSLFTMWLGERITEVGVGNGISLLIFVGILSTAGMALIANFTQLFNFGSEEQVSAAWQLIGFVLLTLAIFAFIVFIDMAERKIPISYAKQIKGRKQYGGQSTHIPIKVNASGVLPIIFSTALITFPQLIAQLFSGGSGGFYGWWQEWLGAGTWLYSILVALLILFFSYFYAQIQFNPEEVAKNIQQYGGFIPGIRPGKPTADYMAKISNRITLFGAFFLMFIALVPSLIFSLALGSTSLVNAFSSTGMLIVVSVALEFDKQLDTLLTMKQYKGFLK